MTNPSSVPVTVFPTMRYRDASAAIEWLIRAFGFEKRVAYTSETGEVMHAELTYGNGMIMLGTARDDEYGTFVGLPADCGGKSTQCAYVVVDHVKEHLARATEAGAKVTMPLKEEPHGSMYCCQDLEGHLWCFGDYDPWKSPAAA